MTTALVIIDIQNDYFAGGNMPLEGAEAAAVNARRLLAEFRGCGLPVFHVQHIMKRPNATFFLPGTSGAEIHPAVAPVPEEAVVVKHFPNSFRETTLLDGLNWVSADHLVVAGMMTHMCVDTTVRAAFDLGFKVTLAHDACATRAVSFNGVAVRASQVQAAYIGALHGLFAEARATAEIAAD
jgi:nicotinamidase-related amidase